MIDTSTLIRPLAAIAAVLVSTSIASAEPVVVTGAPGQIIHQERVDFADLDLRQSSARQTLFRRVLRASTDVCIRAEGEMNMNRVLGDAANTCPNRTYRVARRQVMAAIRRASSGEAQTATAVVVSVPALAR